MFKIQDAHPAGVEFLLFEVMREICGGDKGDEVAIQMDQERASMDT